MNGVENKPLGEIIVREQVFGYEIDKIITEIEGQFLMINKIRNLNDLSRVDVRGVYKKWVYNSLNDYHKICDYLQKINYSIQDLNEELKINEKISLKKTIIIIVLIDWIKEACTATYKLIRDDVKQKFCYSKSEELKKANDFFIAIRSFVVAHPLSTNRHSKFEFDGDFICIDVRSFNNPFTELLSGHSELFCHIDYSGLKRSTIERSDDLLLRSYSGKANNFKYSVNISCKLHDIIHVAELYIEKLYELDRYLKKQKKVDYKL